MTAALTDAGTAGRAADPGRLRVTPRRHLALAGAVVAVSALGLTGCAALQSDSSAGSAASSAVDAVREPAPAAAADGTVSGAFGAPAQKDTTTSAATQPLAVPVTRAVITTADQSVRVADVTRSTDQLGVVAARYRATIDNQVTSQGDGSVPSPAATKDTSCAGAGCASPVPTYGYESSTTTLRVDGDKVDALLRDTAALGTVEASSRSSSDVTAEVADVDARVANAEASLARIRVLMAKATSIGDIVALESEMSRRQADLEALQARQRTLADQTAQATVTVRLFDDNAPTASPEETTGFVAGLQAGWKAFTGALVGAMTVLGALLPFAIVLVPLAWFGRVVWRRRRSDAEPPALATSTEG